MIFINHTFIGKKMAEIEDIQRDKRKNRTVPFLSCMTLLFLVLLIPSVTSASSYEWGTVQVDQNTVDLPDGTYKIFLDIDNPQYPIENFSPTITKSTIPTLTGIYVYDSANVLSPFDESKKILSIAESYSFIMAQDFRVIKIRLPAYLIGFPQLKQYVFYDSGLKRNIYHYAIGDDPFYHSVRKNYYLKVIREMVYQNNSLKTDFIRDRMSQTSQALKLIGGMSKLSEAGLKVYQFMTKSSECLPQVVYYINAGDGQAIKNILEMDDTMSLGDFQEGTHEIIQQIESNSNVPGEPSFLKNIKNLEKALKGLEALLLAQKVGFDTISAVVYWIMQNDVFIERLEALDKFFIDNNELINNHDPIIIQAFNDFKNEFGDLQTYILNNIITSENIRSFENLIIDFGSLLSPYGIAIYPLTDVLLELFQDMDWVHYTIASHTFLKLVWDYLGTEFPLLENYGYINYKDTYNLLLLMQMFISQSYVVDDIFEQLTCLTWASIVSPADWFKFIFDLGSGDRAAICSLAKVYKTDALNIFRIINNSYLWTDVIHNQDLTYSQFFELPGNFNFIESKIKDKDIINVSIIVKDIYSVNETDVLEVKLQNILSQSIDGATVYYLIKDNNDLTVNSGKLEPLGNGQYQASFSAPNAPGTFTIEVTATKEGYENGVGTKTFDVNGIFGEITCSPSSINTFIPPLSSSSLSITLKNTGDFTKTVTVSKTGVKSSWLSYVETAFNIPARSVRIFNFDINVDASAIVGNTYSSQIIFSYDGKTLPITIDVYIPDRSNPDTPVIGSGGNIDGNSEFKNILIDYDEYIDDSNGDAKAYYTYKFTINQDEYDRFTALECTIKYMKLKDLANDSKIGIFLNGKAIWQSSVEAIGTIREKTITIEKKDLLVGENEFKVGLWAWATNSNKYQWKIEYINLIKYVDDIVWTRNLSVAQEKLDEWIQGWAEGKISVEILSTQESGMINLMINGKYFGSQYVPLGYQGTIELKGFQGTIFSTLNQVVLKPSKPNSYQNTKASIGSVHLYVKYYSGDPNLKVTKTVSPPVINRGEESIVTITMENTGTNSAYYIKFNDSLPTGLTLQSGSLSGGTNIIPPENNFIYQYTIKAENAGAWSSPVFTDTKLS